MELPSLLSSRGLIFSFEFSKAIDVVQIFLRHEDVCRPHKPLGGGKVERERNKNWNFSNDIFLSSYVLWSTLAACGSWVRADKLHFQRQWDKYHRGRQEEETLVHFMQDNAIQPTSTQSLMKFSYAVSAIANEDGWPLSHLFFYLYGLLS